MLYLKPDPRHLISDTGTWHVILDTWSTTLDIWHRCLTCYTWHLIFDTWYLTPVLDMLYLTPDLWYLTPDLWHLLSGTGTWHVITWHLILDTWYMTLDNWHTITYLTCFHMVLVHLTWCCDTWRDAITPDTCITLYIHDYHFYGDFTWLLYCYQTLVLLNSCAPELLYIWTAEKGKLLILYSCWSLY